MKTIRKALIIAMLAGATIAGMTGCGSDKFVGDWVYEPKIEESGLLVNGRADADFKKDSPMYSKVHIEKNGDAYLVTRTDYYYTEKSNVNFSKSSGIPYDMEVDFVGWEHVNWYFDGKKKLPPRPSMGNVIIPMEVSVKDYTFTLNKKVQYEKKPATVKANGTIFDVQTSNWEDSKFTYAEKDNTMTMPLRFGGELVLKKTDKDTMKDYMESIKDTVKKIVARKDQETKDAVAANKTQSRFLNISGDIIFDDSALDK